MIETPTCEKRIYCKAPGIRNHNGTPKPVATITDDGLWVFCRWSREMEFVSKEECLAAWGIQPKEDDKTRK